MELFGPSLSIPSEVYEPAEDSELLAYHSQNLKGKILEIGTGSGLTAILNAKRNPSNQITATDINPEALECAKKNANANGATGICFLNSDLFQKIGGKFNYIIFNPPYPPTSEEEKLEGPINRAFDGGKDGRETLDRFLNEFEKYLEPNGTILLVQSSLNSSEKTLATLQGKGFATRILEERPFFFEIIYLIEAQRIA